MQNRLIAVALLTSFFGLNSQLSTARAQPPFGNALSLDGVNQYATVPTVAGSAVNSPMTIEAWIYVRAYANWSRLMDFGAETGANNIVCALSSSTSGQPSLYFFNESGEILANITSPTALPLNVWTHLAFTYNGTNGSILINGSLAISAPMTAPSSATRTSNLIGRSNFAEANGDANANAMIDEFRIWSMARSQAQLQASMGAPLVGNESGLLLYYRFDNIGGTVATNSATATGAPYNGTILANTEFSPGARTVGDPYLPELGNGGYDVQHYDLTINYDPGANTMVSTAAITIRSTQSLSEFSLDLRDFPGATAAIDGIAAGVSRLGDKLIITPASGIVSNRVFQAVVNYSGTPAEIEDPDGAFEGWVRIIGGGFVVNQPMGAMGWFPNNNVPSDKATYDFHIKIPNTHTALGNGELAAKVNNGDGTTTWNWHMGVPMATYLSTATVGLFDYTKTFSATTLGVNGNPLEIYNAFESALSAAQKSAAVLAAGRQDAIIKFIANEIGAPYPFNSTGVVLHRNSLGYALEVQTKSHFSGTSISLPTLAHEIAHQWFGDSVGPATWREIWFNEGFATWWQWYWDNQQNGNPTTVQQRFTSNYNSTSQPTRWNTPPANLPDASALFNTFPVYTRPAMMLEAYRQIVGNSTFFAFQRALVSEYAYSTISGAQFIALAKRLAQERSGFEASYLAQLDEFFQQWLHGVDKPTLIPTTFFLDLQPRLTMQLLSASQLEITWPSTSATYSLEETDNLSGTSWSPVLSPQVANNGVTKVVLVPPSGNHFFRLRKN